MTIPGVPKKCDLSGKCSVRKAFIKKKSVTFFTFGSDPPPYFVESVTKIKKEKKIRTLKCNFKPF